MWFPILSALWRSRPEQRPARRKPASTRLTVEALEDRTVPAFLAPVTSPGGGGSLIVGDFNKDRLTDVAVMNSDNTVSVRLSNGDGTFRLSSTLKHAKGDLIIASVSDANGDGKLDIRVLGIKGHAGTYGQGYSNVWLGNGDGTFGQVGITSLGAVSWYPGVIFNTPDTNGDFNNDGILDRATVNGTNVVSVSLRNGDATYQPAKTYDAGPSAGSIAAGDFNGDGLIDLVVVNSLSSSNPTLSVLFNDGNWV